MPAFNQRGARITNTLTMIPIAASDQIKINMPHFQYPVKAFTQNGVYVPAMSR